MERSQTRCTGQDASDRGACHPRADLPRLRDPRGARGARAAPRRLRQHDVRRPLHASGGPRLTALTWRRSPAPRAGDRRMAELQRTLEALIAARFPTAPLSPAQTIHRITGVDGLHRLSIAVVRVIDLARAERQASAAPLAGVGRVEDVRQRQLPGNARAADRWSARNAGSWKRLKVAGCQGPHRP